MITLKNAKQIQRMRTAGRIALETTEKLAELIRPGVSTWELDAVAEQYILSRNAKPACKHYHGFPATICTSIDEEVVHGIPSKDRILREGQLISIDIVVRFEGFHADMARTYAVGAISPDKQKLLDTTQASFFEAVRLVAPGAKLSAISLAIQEFNESRGYSLVRALTGHGIGKHMHEDPVIPNYFSYNSPEVILETGMALCIEPMVCMGDYKVDFAPDGWTVTTADKRCAAHYENTVVVTSDGYDILTLID